MFFVTDEPILFNAESGTMICIRKSGVTETTAEKRVEIHEIIIDDKRPIFSGSRQDCEDFVYSLAGWVGAVNPVTLEKETRK